MLYSMSLGYLGFVTLISFGMVYYNVWRTGCATETSDFWVHMAEACIAFAIIEVSYRLLMGIPVI